MSQRYGKVVYQFLRDGFIYRESDNTMHLTEKGIKLAEQLIGLLASTYYEDRRSSYPIIKLE